MPSAKALNLAGPHANLAEAGASLRTNELLLQVGDFNLAGPLNALVSKPVAYTQAAWQNEFQKSGFESCSKTLFFLSQIVSI